MSLTVLDPGPFSILVDGGRVGARALGVPGGGAADRAAFALGNALVGNSPDAVALEITLAGPTLRADHRTAGVVFGAPFTLTIPGRRISPVAGTTFTLEPGETLRIGGTPAGVRGYLCVPGGFDSPTILGSRSALDPIRVGEVLACDPSAISGRSIGVVASSDALGTPKTVLRAIDGPQADWFSPGFFDREYTVTPAGNRMGVRLAGEPLSRRPGELVSEPVAPGAVQVTNDGLPVVLGVDGQTIGGYPKVAHVVRADLDAVAQLRPGTVVRFARVTLADAEKAASERSAKLREWRTRLAVG